MGMQGAKAVSWMTVTVTVAAACALAMASAAGCSNKSSGGGGPDASFDTGGPEFDGTADSPEPVDAPGPTDSPKDSPATTDGPATIDSSTAGDGGLPDGYVGFVENIPVSGQIVALAANVTTGKLYAAQFGSGIAVIDDGTLTVTATIPPVMTDAGPVGPFAVGNVQMAVDETANLLYAVRGSIIDVFDLSTNAYKTTFDVATLDTGCTGSVEWIAIDGPRSLLYTSCDPPLLTVEVSVISTAGGNYSLVAGIPLHDLASNQAALALDTTNQRLFVSSPLPSPTSPQMGTILVDEIDTATNTQVVGMQQNLGTGAPVGTMGAAGSAVLLDVTNPDAGPDAAGGTFFSLEPSSAPTNGPGFVFVPCPGVPTKYVVLVASPFDPSSIAVYTYTVAAEPNPPTSTFFGTVPTWNTLGGPIEPTNAACTRRVCAIEGYEYGATMSQSMPFGIFEALDTACR